MYTERDNQQLTQVGPGTPMGNLLRRYWHPVAAAAELDDHPTRPFRLMGEDLVLYKDLRNTYGILGRHCPHRGADLAYGFAEACGLRCHYHGWLFNGQGRCLEQPFEEVDADNSRFRDEVRARAYRVEQKSGLLWAYLGPEPAPLVPNWEPFTWKNGFVQIVFSTLPCNWLQGQENSIDPVHFEWLHANWSQRLGGGAGAGAPRHLKIDFREFDYGFTYHRLCEGFDEAHPLWRIGRVCLWPNALFANGHFEWRVPIDDANTLSVGWFFDRVPRDREPFEQAKIPYWHSRVIDPRTNRLIDSHVMNQDFVAWIGQGRIADRTRENLARSDRGVVLLRRRFLRDLATIADGGEPKAVVRDPELNRCITLPIVGRDLYRDGLSRDDLGRHFDEQFTVTANRFIFLAGQPGEVRSAYEEAMGFKMVEDGYIRKNAVRG